MTIKTLTSSLRVCGWLLWTDIRFIGKDFFNNIFDSFAWPTVLIFIHGYVGPSLGLPADYGAFTAVSMVVIMGSFDAWAGSAAIAADLEGEKTILYDLTLPLPYWMAWLRKGVSLAIKAALFNVMPLILGKIILGSSFDLSNFSVWKFLMIYLIASLFFGMFALLTTVIAGSFKGHSRLELRLIGPMFFLNGWTASWAVMYAALPMLGALVLCFPWIYAYEGCRAAILGQEGYLPLWMCCTMLSLFIGLAMFASARLFKRRMDCV